MSHRAGSNGIKNVIIAFSVHMHCTAGILDLVLDDVIAYNNALCNLIRAWGAVTREIVQNTRPSFSHMRGGAGHETKLSSGPNMTCCIVPCSSWGELEQAPL